MTIKGPVTAQPEAWWRSIRGNTCFILVCQDKLNQSVHENKILSDFQMGKEGFNLHDVHTVMIKIFY